MRLAIALMPSLHAEEVARGAMGWGRESGTWISRCPRVWVARKNGLCRSIGFGGEHTPPGLGEQQRCDDKEAVDDQGEDSPVAISFCANSSHCVTRPRLTGSPQGNQVPDES